MRDTQYFFTEAEAIKHQNTPSTAWREVFKDGYTSCKVIDPDTKQEVDGWVSTITTYGG